MPRYGFLLSWVKSIHTSSANEKSAPVAMTAPIAEIQLLKCDRGFGAGGVGEEESDMDGAGGVGIRGAATRSRGRRG